LKKNIIFKLILILFLISCNQDNLYTNYFDFKNEEWYADSSIVFRFSSKNDTNLNFNLSLSYSNEYPYQNIYTSYSLLDSSKNILKSEMIEYQLFEKKYGYPLGSGVFKDFVLDTSIIDSIILKKNSEYIFLVKHSMRENKLSGVSRLALDIKKN
tara:strand:+ start:1285 stop:1749 length:465 start_codon:yes stop_codon:yes gene_type:complete